MVKTYVLGWKCLNAFKMDMDLERMVIMQSLKGLISFFNA